MGLVVGADSTPPPYYCHYCLLPGTADEDTDKQGRGSRRTGDPAIICTGRYSRIVLHKTFEKTPGKMAYGLGNVGNRRRILYCRGGNQLGPANILLANP